MALIKCPECGKEISDKSNQCIHCGYPLIIKNEHNYMFVFYYSGILIIYSPSLEYKYFSLAYLATYEGSSNF